MRKTTVISCIFNLMTCVLVLLFTCHAAWAVKPERTPPGQRETFSGHAVFMSSDGILNDTEEPYKDLDFGGKDDVEITTDKTTGDQLLRLDFRIGPESSRRVAFANDFDITGEKIDPIDSEAGLLYDFLGDYDDTYGTLGSDVRMGVWYRKGAEDYFDVAFIVANITRAKLLEDGVPADVLERYIFSVNDYFVYRLRYAESPVITGNSDDGWTIKPPPPLPSPDKVTLYVQRRMVESKGNSGKTKLSWEREDIDLATYSLGVPFKLIVKAGPPPPPPPPQGAPGRHKTLPSIWGKLKAK